MRENFSTQAGLSYTVVSRHDGTLSLLRSEAVNIDRFDAGALKAALVEAGYPATVAAEKINRPLMFALISLLMIMGGDADGPCRHTMWNSFPAKIRYTSISIPYNVGAAVFGGLAPFMMTAIAVKTGNVYGGIWYVVVVGRHSGADRRALHEKNPRYGRDAVNAGRNRQHRHETMIRSG